MTRSSPGRGVNWPRALLFDLDGTLIDSVPDLANAVNELLAGDALPPQSLDAVRAMIGNGVRKLVERAYRAAGQALDSHALDAATDRMMGIYGRHLTNRTVLMPGAREMVVAYHMAGVRIAVVTNKPEAFTREILSHFGLQSHVHAVVGGDTGPARKPAPDMLLHALKQLRTGTGNAVMVGDSPADIDAAKAAGIAGFAVRGGYTTVPVDNLGADRVISSLMELPAALDAFRVSA
ncbi:phosphoglycolate phosphatase [Hoeflea olei]|uniref:phosphoglycolate phosphatase n=1 Tax=Hoeflea olei TaxID=1480615 RepID=UPI000B013B30|nr:phosphoglycolate phosphatase [Hoeflea olei]